MKKFAFGLGLAFSIIFGLTGCGNESVIDENTAVSAEDIVESNVPFLPENAISIEDIDWSISNGLIDGKRKLLFSYANNTDYTIYRVEMEFAPKDGTTVDDFSVLLASATDEDIVEFTESFDTYIGRLTMDSTNYQITAPGESADGSTCSMGSLVIQTSDQCEFMEPNIVTISFIGANGLGYKTSYDFKYETYSTSPRDGIELQQWPDSEISSLLPKADFDVIEIDRDKDDWFAFYAYGLSKNDYDVYVEAIKTAGFTYSPSNGDKSFAAYNDNDVYVVAQYNSNKYELYLRISGDVAVEESDHLSQIVESDDQFDADNADALEIRPEFQEVIDSSMDNIDLMIKIYDIINQYNGSVETWTDTWLEPLMALTPESADEALRMADVFTYMFNKCYDAGMLTEEELSNNLNEVYTTYIEPYE